MRGRGAGAVGDVHVVGGYTVLSCLCGAKACMEVWEQGAHGGKRGRIRAVPRALGPVLGHTGNARGLRVLRSGRLMEQDTGPTSLSDVGRSQHATTYSSL